MATRNPARVLPDPVGAAMRVSVPWAMSGQPCSWGREGPSGKRRANQVATAGWNPSSPPEPAGSVEDWVELCVEGIRPHFIISV